MNIDPINLTVAVLNVSALTCLIVCVVTGRRRLKQRRRMRPTLTLMQDPRQCVAFFRRLRVGISSNLPALTKEDHL